MREKQGDRQAHNGGPAQDVGTAAWEPIRTPASKRKMAIGGQCYVSGEASLTARLSTHHGGSRRGPTRGGSSLGARRRVGTSSECPGKPETERDSQYVWGGKNHSRSRHNQA